MIKIYIYYNGSLLEAYSCENMDKAIRLLKKVTKFDVIINIDNDRYVFEVELDEAAWKIKRDNIE